MERRKRELLFVLNYNGTKMTCDLLSSLRSVFFPHPVWVVDNGSDKDDSAAFETAFPGVVVKKIAENCGFAGGVNKAVRMAADEGYEFVYEINNDTLATDDFLLPCLEIMERRPDVDVVASRTRTLNPKTGEFSIWGYHSKPKEARCFPDGFLETKNVLGCGMLLRVKTFLEFGGLDERFFCYCEETDYCFRLAKAGRKLGIAANSLILHQGAATTTGTGVLYYGTRNTLLFSRLHDSSWMGCSQTLAKKAVFPGWKALFTGKALSAAVIGHAFSDAIRGRFGKRKAPFRKIRGVFLFVLLSPVVLLYAIAISATLHPWRPRPEP